MKITSHKLKFLCLTLVISANFLISQTHAQDVVLPDSVTSDTQQEQAKKPKKDKNKKDEFKAFGGINFSVLSTESEFIDPTVAAGWLLGAAYKRGNVFYWGVGTTYNNSIYNLTDSTQTPGPLLDRVFSVRNIDVPVTVGMNIVPFGRIVGFRIFTSAVPSFTLRLGDNELGISKDNINTVNLYGQAGLGVDLVFLFLEAGYNYGFADLFKNDVKSNPKQIFINLGFRF